MNNTDFDDLLVPFAESWTYTTLAECCYENFLFEFGSCVDSFDKDTELPPCMPPPELSGLWYVNHVEGKDDECVKECDVGESCNGRASIDKELYSTFDDCCATHLWHLENSPCNSCKEDFWETYFASSPEPELGYYPICKSHLSRNASDDACPFLSCSSPVITHFNEL